MRAGWFFGDKICGWKAIFVTVGDAHHRPQLDPRAGDDRVGQRRRHPRRGAGPRGGRRAVHRDQNGILSGVVGGAMRIRNSLFDA